MSTTIEIQWKILGALPQAPKKISSSALLSKLKEGGYETTKRSVERHLIALSAIFPITSDTRNKPYGWFWAREALSMTVPGMELQTALAFVAAEAFLRPLLPRSTLTYLDPHFKQARETLDKAPDTFGAWRSKIRTLPRGFRLLAPEIDRTVQDTVYEALLKNRALELDYQRRDETEPRQLGLVNPLALVYRDPLVYLVCTMWDYDDPRQIVLHRVKAATLLETPARALPGFDIDAYIAAGEFGIPAGPPIRLDATFDADAAAHLWETPISEDQTLTRLKDGRVRVTATVPHTQELVWWLRGFGSLVRVRRPRIE